MKPKVLETDCCFRMVSPQRLISPSLSQRQKLLHRDIGESHCYKLTVKNVQMHNKHTLALVLVP